MSVIIRLQNLPMSANASNIRRFFSGLSIPEGGVHIVGGSDGDAFIAFATDEDARKAMLLDRQAINGAAVRLFLSSKTEMQSIIESARNSALFPVSARTSVSQSIPPQKTETMQALDVTAPTLPTSFPSYRNGEVRDLYSSERVGSLNYPQASRPPSVPHNPPPFEDRTSGCSTLTSRPPVRPFDHAQNIDSSLRDSSYDFGHPVSQPFSRCDAVRSHLDPNEFSRSRGTFGGARSPLPQFNSYYSVEAAYARQPEENLPLRQSDNTAVGHRAPYVDPRNERGSVNMLMDYERPRSPVQDRFIPQVLLNDRREVNPEVNGPQFRDNNYSSSRAYSNMHPPHRPPSERDSLNRQTVERDFSVRPPWLNDNDSPGPKRPGPPTDFDEYPRKRSVAASNITKPLVDNRCETDFVVRVALPVSEVGIKAIFEILRGVHIIPKWGIRIEEDALQRPTGYIFIMMTGRDSFDRALSCNNKQYKGFPVRVNMSSGPEFFAVTDSNFRSKCPPEISKRLPSTEQSVSPPHHSDGCLEITELPQDVSKTEIVRFLGAPGLTIDSVELAGFASNDKTAPQGSFRIRALVILPSPKDIGILLSVKPRPLRPDGTCPPVRLTAISRMQLDAYTVFRIDEISRPSVPVLPESVSNDRVMPSDSVPVKADYPLSCAYLSGLSKSMTDSDVLRLFSTVLIPGDAIRMVGPNNTSAYIDFISENNCRRAISDITANDSKAKTEHSALMIQAISRSDMEQRMGESVDDIVNASERTTRPPVRDKDPRETRNQWDPRLRAPHYPPLAPFHRRSPTGNRPKFEDYREQGMLLKPFEEIPHEPFPGHLQRSRPALDFPHSGPPPMYNDLVSPRATEHPPLPGPPRRPPMMNVATVFISNLPPSVTQEQLANVMRDYYFIPGSIRLRRDLQGVPTGDALVDFRSTYDAERTIRELSGYRIAGRPLIMQHDRLPGNL